MTELSIQYGCDPATGDYGNLTQNNIATMNLILSNNAPSDSGVIWWTDTSLVPQLETDNNPSGLSGAVSGLLEPTESGGIVSINTGVGIVLGYIYFNDEKVDFDIDNNAGNANATDIIVLQFTRTSNTIRLARINGAAGSTDVLTQTTDVYEVPICEVELDGTGS